MPMLSSSPVGGMRPNRCRPSCQQVAREDDALPVILSQPLLGQKVGVLA